MDTKKFQRATEINCELTKMYESLDNLKNANELIFSFSDRVETMEELGDKSPAFILCREIVVAECEKRIAQLEKEFNEL